MMLYTILVALVLAASPTFDDGEAYSSRKDVNLSQSRPDKIIYNLFRKKPELATRLLVITEPSWCPPCLKLDPVLNVLKKQGYDIHKYSQDKWYKAKKKPEGLPKKLVAEGRRSQVPTMLFVKADSKTNRVVHWTRGLKDEKYIKRYLTK